MITAFDISIARSQIKEPCRQEISSFEPIFHANFFVVEQMGKQADYEDYGHFFLS